MTSEVARDLLADNMRQGTSTTFNIALTDGGPVTILYGVRLKSVTAACVVCAVC